VAAKTAAFPLLDVPRGHISKGKKTSPDAALQQAIYRIHQGFGTP
jgi:hypothetical protein